MIPQKVTFTSKGHEDLVLFLEPVGDVIPSTPELDSKLIAHFGADVVGSGRVYWNTERTIEIH